MYELAIHSFQTIKNKSIEENNYKNQS